ICWRFSHGKPVAAAGAPATASGATAGGGADVAPTNSLNGRHSAIPDCQPKSVARNCPVVRPWRICSRVNSPSFAPSRATWIIGMGWFYEARRAKSMATRFSYSDAATTSVESAFYFLLRRVERAPEIPGGHRTVRAPFLADLRELFRRRQFSPAKGFRETFLDAVISDGPDIKAAQFEKQQHLHRPPPDAAHLRQPFDN